MIDTTPILTRVAALAEDLERDYGPDAEVSAAIVIVEVITPSDDPDAAGSVIEHRATTQSTAHVLGIVELASDSLREPYGVIDDE